ncbi:MAG: sulfurtransferase TusA family protein [Thiohalobacteraceae bacterium]
MGWFGRHKRRQPSALKRVDQTVTLADQSALRVQVCIDCLGAVCPRPQLLTLRAIDQMSEGEVLELLVDNPSSAEAIPAMGMALGMTHLATLKDAHGWRIYVRKGYPK